MQYIQLRNLYPFTVFIFEASKSPFQRSKKKIGQFLENYMVFKYSLLHSNKSQTPKFFFPCYSLFQFKLLFSLFILSPKAKYIRNIYHRYSAGSENVNFRNCSVGTELSFPA